jgi:hypothetical protein
MAVNPDDYEQRGKYWYRKDLPSGRSMPREWKICEGCGVLSLIGYRCRFCSHNCNPPPPTFWGEDHPLWRGDEAQYHVKHMRLYRARGKADMCIFGCEASMYHWASMTGNLGDVHDYAPMCVPCHKRYDLAVLSMIRS